MRGYTAKKGNRYYAVIYEGVDPATGKERRRWYPAGSRKADAEKLVTELVKRHNDGEYRPPERLTVGEYLTERWLPAQRSQLKATTFHSYESNIRLHVLPTLGCVPLARLAPEDIDGLYARLLESGRRNRSGDGPGLSPSRCGTCTGSCARRSTTPSARARSPATPPRSPTRRSAAHAGTADGR